MDTVHESQMSTGLDHCYTLSNLEKPELESLPNANSLTQGLAGKKKSESQVMSMNESIKNKLIESKS